MRSPKPGEYAKRRKDRAGQHRSLYLVERDEGNGLLSVREAGYLDNASKLRPPSYPGRCYIRADEVMACDGSGKALT